MAFHCQYCNKSYATKEEYLSCIVRCTCPNPHICPECNLAFDTTQKLRYHCQIQHKQDFKCTECKMVFGQLHDMIKHIAYAHPADFACAQSMLALRLSHLD